MADMKLWELRPRDGLIFTEDPWVPWYDKAFGFVVRAETERRARELAQAESGDESDEKTPWLNPYYSTCVEIEPDGEDEVIMRDFASG